MSNENRFNLIDEPWLPVVDVGPVSLRDIFRHHHYRALGGNPLQKIAVTKLLLTIAQAAVTPGDDEEWAALKPAGMAAGCLAYLECWRERFWLYGEQPFLQMPAISAASVQRFGAVQTEVATGNTTVLTQIQSETALTDAEKALLIVVLMGFGLGGKKTDNTVVLSPAYTAKSNGKGKPATGKPGPSLGYKGFLHSFLQGRRIVETLWLNLITLNQLQQLRLYGKGVGTPPWETMPVGEDCEVAQDLRDSLIGRLLPFSRFCLLTETGLHYSEGIAHQGYKEGVVDPSVSADFSGKEPKAIWVDPEKRPWRFLTVLLSFLEQSAQPGFDCQQLRFGLERARTRAETLGVWSGGLRVSSNAGEQFVSGTDDFVESVVMLPENIPGEIWFSCLKLEMAELDHLSRIVYSATLNYYKTQNMDGKNRAGQAGNLFWRLCEHEFQNLVHVCAEINRTQALRKKFASFVNQAYDLFCARDTARQLDAWARNRPNLGKYLQDQIKYHEAHA
ncbi:MAG: type I-E CRISPR-associated protein Cse1/CasA [Methylococcales bacterium]|nr:type I-E CRISPR-associated protein Cse1/CasA [Methylococcales bacterium]